MNLQLPQLLTRPKPNEPPPSSNDVDVVPNLAASALADEVARLKAAVIANPEEALSVSLLREKIRVQEELVGALRDDLKEVKEQGRWYLGSMIAVIAGLLGVVVTLFVALRSK